MNGLTKAAGDLALIDSAAHYGRNMSDLTNYNHGGYTNTSYTAEDSSDTD